MEIIQGDEYNIPFVVSYGELTITPDIISRLEIVIGKIKKYYPDTITYDPEQKVFNFPLKQNDTINVVGKQAVQIRCLFKTGDVKGVFVDNITVKKGLSQEILEAD